MSGNAALQAQVNGSALRGRARYMENNVALWEFLKLAPLSVSPSAIRETPLLFLVQGRG